LLPQALEEMAEAGSTIAKGAMAVAVLEQSSSWQVLLLGLLPGGDKAANDSSAQPSKHAPFPSRRRFKASRRDDEPAGDTFAK
jgi:hypothetical protein